MIILALVLFVSTSLYDQQLYGQERSAYFDESGDVVLPTDYREDARYPLLVMLPYTGGTAVEQARAFGIEPGEQEDVILLLPQGRYHYTDYLPDFPRFVSWFEERLYEDIAAALDEYAIDSNSIYLAGYSLGGDLAWALSVRNPGDFAGAIVAGSRSSHPVNEDKLQRLSDDDFRAAFLIGNNDSPNRYNGLNHARRRLEAVNVPVMYREYDGGHELPPQELSIEALEYISETNDRAIRASGSSWPQAPVSETENGRRAGTSARGGSLLSHIFGTERTTGQVRFETDMPIAVSSRYSNGVGYAGIDSSRIVFETFLGSGWVSADTGIVSSVTTAESYSRRASSGLWAGFGEPVTLGGGVSWDWARWVSEGPLLSDIGNPNSGVAVSRRPRISAIALLRDDRDYTPRAAARFSYEIPSFVSPFVFSHVANMDLEFEAWATDRLLLDGGIAAGTRRRVPGDNDDSPADSLDRHLSWNLGIGYALNEEVTISVSSRGVWLEDISGNGSGPRSGYNQDFRLVLRYNLL